MGKKKHAKAKLIIVGGTFGSTSIPLINQWSNAKTFESICSTEPKNQTIRNGG